MQVDNLASIAEQNRQLKLSDLIPNIHITPQLSLKSIQAGWKGVGGECRKQARGV